MQALHRGFTRGFSLLLLLLLDASRDFLRRLRGFLRLWFLRIRFSDSLQPRGFAPVLHHVLEAQLRLLLPRLHLVYVPE
jgi:hypothetical protein